MPMADGSIVGEKRGAAFSEGLQAPGEVSALPVAGKLPPQFSSVPSSNSREVGATQRAWMPSTV